jgi:uncharacterized protein (DUF58 family)
MASFGASRRDPGLLADGEEVLDELDTLDARQFTIAIRKLATSLTYGIDKSPFLGSGIEYVQSRPYEPGDPIRAIDWRVTARVGRYFVKEYETPKSMPCYLLIDTSASMAVSSQRRSKYATALFLAGGLAFACLDRVSPVGVIGVGERALRVSPSLSGNRVLQWLLQLRRYRVDERTTLGASIHRLGAMLPQRSLVIVLSDLHDPHAAAALRRLVQLHDVVVLRLEDPAESGLRGAGYFRAREAETGREFVAHGRMSWADPAAAAREVERAGIDHLRIRTDRPFVHELRHLFRVRGMAARGAR